MMTHNQNGFKPMGFRLNNIKHFHRFYCCSFFRKILTMEQRSVNESLHIIIKLIPVTDKLNWT